MFYNDRYSIGCPVWSSSHWKGSVYPPAAPKHKWLKHYSATFPTVEGNSTFYGIPHPDTFRRWADETDPRFEFCLKFPRVVSHDFELVGCEGPLNQFLIGLDILETQGRLGPTFLQLGPAFSPGQFPALIQFLDRLPTEHAYAVEVRHLGWFESEAQARLFDALEQRKIDRVIFDSRPLYSLPATDEFEEKSQRRKPKIPIRAKVTGERPMLRLVGRNDVGLANETTSCDAAIDAWTGVVAQWIQSGLKPIVFTHTPDDQFAPEFAMRFHRRLSEKIDGLPKIEKWNHAPATQQKLF